MEMVAQLDEKSMSIVVKGKDGRSCGLIGCYFARRPNSYDHNRHRKLKDEGTPLLGVRLPIWDFVIERADGAAVRLHPHRSTMNVETFVLEGHEEPVEPPPRGKGGSWGRGTYRHYKGIGTKELLRLDARKGQGLQPFKKQ
jgi:hypothetical protein